MMAYIRLFGAMLVSCVLACVVSAARADDAKFDFRKKQFDDQWFKYAGAGASDCIELGDDGLRIHYPDGKAREPVGIVWNCRVRGDFVATARYAILKADSTPLGAGVEVYVMLDNENQDGIPVVRLNRVAGGRVFQCQVRTYDDKKRRVSRGMQEAKMSAESDRGRIRLERKGTDFLASLAEGDDEEFKTVLKIENIGPADVRMLRFAAVSRGAVNAQLDVRLLEFRLQGELLNLPGRAPERDAVAKAPGAPANPAPPENRRWSLWIVIGLAGLLLVTLLAVVAVFALSPLRAAPVAKTRKK